MAKNKTVGQETAELSAVNDSSNVSKFLGETKEELAKVVWPSRQQLISESAAVILMVILVASVIYLVDNFFSWLSTLDLFFG
ncbi:MAG: preprotein translocase subunit SecE [Xenococcaceae cyanobacterium MO_167.B52]|nr:preprotein translocase subunit SecE [Xenococcaceae cyanobacterium MO_167.B52]